MGHKYSQTQNKLPIIINHVLIYKKLYNGVDPY